MVPTGICQEIIPALDPFYNIKIQFARALKNSINDYFELNVCRYCNSDDILTQGGMVGLVIVCRNCCIQYYIEWA